MLGPRLRHARRGGQYRGETTSAGLVTKATWTAGVRPSTGLRMRTFPCATKTAPHPKLVEGRKRVLQQACSTERRRVPQLVRRGINEEVDCKAAAHLGFLGSKANRHRGVTAIGKNRAATAAT